ncbi:MAG TPA: ATP-dependent zinc metalloprotease FtsH [Caldisericia bacterium]|nr:ATP-dependent zinc metalloprotease FtsH [Caldisericia bacterium]HOL82926.1 ATP-dependent zinc metalloprotease FtsH [Caldisericia bacterium]HON83696.1 ATP-dependent zinc metalloprotease FtsH [Caldisericia bacterium]HPC56875.1 ATP-dependent zinc metalloprotease FtsH [Caldisericia bacterium]HPP43574.1 ATP-dependent zinc metalloprotease FtsH [Caldisericia bacterium]
MKKNENNFFNIIRSLIPLILMIVFIYFMYSFYTNANTQNIDKISYSQFISKIKDGDVKEITIDGQNVSGTYMNGNKFSTTLPLFDDPNLPNLLIEKNVNTTIKPTSSSGTWWYILINIGSLVLIIVFWMIMMRSISGGANSQVFNFAKSKAKLFLENKPKITFNDVAGLEEVKEDLQEEIEFLRNPKKFSSIGAKIPKGVLLVGPPGCGKTLLAKAVAGEAGVPFFSVSGSEFVEMFVGVGAARVRDLFNEAKKYSPCIIFIDEIDAVGRQRGAGLGGGHDEREQTLNQLLVEMDGFDPNAGIIVIAATNRPDILDQALLRPGRFDRRIVVNFPDVKEREAILKIHTRNKPLGNDINLPTLAKRTAGFTGADLENLVNEAALLAARRNKNKITMDELEEAIDRVIAGPQKKTRVVSDEEKRVIAFHETGHAVVADMLPHSDPVHRISIISRGMALGYTLQLPQEEKFIRTREQLLSEVTTLLGGRAAEELFTFDKTTGAENDLRRATEIVRKMVTEFGMSDKLGPLTFGRKTEFVFLGRDIASERDYSEQVAYEIDKEVKKTIEDCFEKAKNILKENNEGVKKVVEVLIEKETIEGEELKKILDDVKREKVA